MESSAAAEIEDPSPSNFAPERPEFYAGADDAAFARLRREDPVHWYEGGGGFWCITRHAEVREVSSQPRRFCSGRGTQIYQIALAKLGQDISGGTGLTSIIQMDPPEHNRHRKLVVGQFTPRIVRSMETQIREIARASIAAVPAGASVDFVDTVALPLPMLVIADMLGIPGEDRGRFRVWSDAMIEAGGGGASERTIETLAEMFAYMSDTLARRRSDQRDDLLSTLLHAEIDGERLSESEILIFGLTLLVAGNETTRNLISGGMRALLDHPAQMEKLLSNPALLPNAIEEMLRYVTPVRSFARCATENCDLGGKSIAVGDFVVLFYGSANRDEEIFGPDADDFDIERASAKHHVAFGHGEHLCLGATLARAEARIMFEELLPRLRGVRYDGPLEPLSNVLINGVERMPVVFAT